MFSPFIASFFVIFLHHPPPCVSARPAPLTEIITARDNNYKWQSFERFLNARSGSHVRGISELKRYFHRFGYLPSRDFGGNATDMFDERLKSAIIRYQVKLGLRRTGKLDVHTLSRITSPRCGVSDDETAPFHGLHATRNYVYFPGKPRWARQYPMTLTYSLSPEYSIKSLSVSNIKDAFRRAFAKWESVIPVSFTEAEDYGFADIKIGFYSGDHGDGEPFDGVLGVLAHSFSPETGKFHLDAAETWAVDFESEKSKVAVDLESVAVHEIGHLLGLAHSSVEDAVMYPSLKPRQKKVDLSLDDIQGVQALYGSNPNYTVGSLLESDISTNQAVDLVRCPSSSSSLMWAVFIIITLTFCPRL